MFIKVTGKRFLAVLLAAGLLAGMTGCQNENAGLLSFQEENPAAQVQSLSVQEMNTAETYAEKLCVISKKKAKKGTKADVSFSSSAQLCINVTDRKVVYASGIYDRLYPASVTKLFSAYVVLKYGNLDDTVVVSENAANITEAGAKLSGMKEGEEYSLRSLLELMLVYSANDAALAAAEYIGGSEEAFVEMMNEEAAKIGAVDSHFVNPHGLHDEDHYTTAYDIYLVLNELIKNQDFTDIINMAQCDISYRDAAGEEKSFECTSTNRYLLETQKEPDGMTVVGGKTGTTYAAGSCLAIYSRDEQKKEYISVVLKAGTGDEVFSQMSKLLEMCSGKEE
jgi:D-alanyl-D-alanine carboxypeptidase